MLALAGWWLSKPISTMHPASVPVAVIGLSRFTAIETEGVLYKRVRAVCPVIFGCGGGAALRLLPVNVKILERQAERLLAGNKKDGLHHC